MQICTSVPYKLILYDDAARKVKMVSVDDGSGLAPKIRATLNLQGKGVSNLYNVHIYIPYMRCASMACRL